VKDAIGGVLCRCTGYSKIIQAIMTAADEPAPALRADRGARSARASTGWTGCPR
jgi:aldehyde oxidoreductase